ncbi:hypothetical protein [Allonocardiopsis opalescens]|uniref:Uncharacterized protein n=1 Tax=Allonocardiopsis opalescens TaxID=1144618 RepID=A0A2T0PWT3_9ACTN|nr:hypothetical protein [Allonocardiopsis opalescens]PRX96000.1 hypothetical protein CLV72_1084 [Allonocardiopsis opalescens]
MSHVHDDPDPASGAAEAERGGGAARATGTALGVLTGLVLAAAVLAGALLALDGLRREDVVHLSDSADAGRRYTLDGAGEPLPVTLALVRTPCPLGADGYELRVGSRAGVTGATGQRWFAAPHTVGIEPPGGTAAVAAVEWAEDGVLARLESGHQVWVPAERFPGVW